MRMLISLILKISKVLPKSPSGYLPEPHLLWAHNSARAAFEHQPLTFRVGRLWDGSKPASPLSPQLLQEPCPHPTMGF